MLLRRTLIIFLVLIVTLELCSAAGEEVDNIKERKRREREERKLKRMQREKVRRPEGRKGRKFRKKTTTTTTTIEPPVINNHHPNHHMVHNYHTNGGYYPIDNINVHHNGHHTNALNGNGYSNGKSSYLCPAEFVRLGNGCYYFGQHIATWQDAHHLCRDMGSQLAGLETAWEDQTMRKYLNRPELARLERWIGGMFNWELRRWIWGSSGKRMSYQGFSRRSPNEETKWHCVLMDPTRLFRWTHRSCFEQRHYICESALKVENPDKDKNEII